MADGRLLSLRQAATLADLGGVILLSPACASYGMLVNYEHRGDEFVLLAREGL